MASSNPLVKHTKEEELAYPFGDDNTSKLKSHDKYSAAISQNTKWLSWFSSIILNKFYSCSLLKGSWLFFGHWVILGIYDTPKKMHILILEVGNSGASKVGILRGYCTPGPYF